MPARPDYPAFVCVYGAAGAGKCLAASSEVILADGRVRTMAQIAAGSVGLPTIVALDEQYRARTVPIDAVYANDVKPLLRVHTKSGRTIDCTETHPLLSGQGWKPAAAFDIGEMIAVPRVLPVFGSEDMDESKVKVLAYHLADGRLVDSTLTFTSGNPEKVRDWKHAIEMFADVEVHQATCNGEPTLTYRVARKAGDRKTSSAIAFLRDLGLDEKVAGTKFVPDVVFTLRRPLLALFLNRYLGCDGCYEQKGRVSFSSASERMLRQIAHLLLRFGAIGSIRTKVVKGVTYWEWVTGHPESMEVIRREIGIFTKPIPPRAGNAPNTHDRLPLRGSAVGHMTAAAAWKTSHKYQFITRSRAQTVCEIGDRLHALAHSDVYWDTIDRVEPIEPGPTYDLSVPLFHNFVANDVYVHNSSDCCYSFPRALFVAAPNALEPARSLCGYDPKAQIRQADTIRDAIPLIKVAKDAGLDTIVFDDFSYLAEATVQYHERLHKGKSNGFAVWNGVKADAVDFRDEARYCGLHVILNTWLQGPKLKDGMTLRGGPMLPMKLPEAIPALCDLVLQAGTNPMRRPWGGIYKCYLDSQWTMKDRFHVTPAEAPMNLGEILRAAGYEIKRHPGLPWQEEMVEKIARAVLNGAPEAEFFKSAWAVLEARNHHPKHIAWTMRDAVDRVALRRATVRTATPAAFGWA